MARPRHLCFLKEGRFSETGRLEEGKRSSFGSHKGGHKPLRWRIEANV